MDRRTDSRLQNKSFQIILGVFICLKHKDHSCHVYWSADAYFSLVCKRSRGTFLSFLCHTSGPLAAIEMDTRPLYHEIVELRHYHYSYYRFTAEIGPCIKVSCNVKNDILNNIILTKRKKAHRKSFFRFYYFAVVFVKDDFNLCSRPTPPGENDFVFIF